MAFKIASLFSGNYFVYFTQAKSSGNLSLSQYLQFETVVGQEDLMNEHGIEFQKVQELNTNDHKEYFKDGILGYSLSNSNVYYWNTY